MLEPRFQPSGLPQLKDMYFNWLNPFMIYDMYLKTCNICMYIHICMTYDMSLISHILYIVYCIIRVTSSFKVDAEGGHGLPSYLPCKTLTITLRFQAPR